MTDRERWTVYPLLFLALGITVKDKLVKFVDVDRVHCKKLVLTGPAGKDRVELTTVPAAGLLRQRGGADARDTWLALSDNLAGLMLFDEQGKLRPWVVAPQVPRRVAAPRAVPRESPAAPRQEQTEEKKPAAEAAQPAP